MNNYAQRISFATTKDELHKISYEAFINENSRTYNKVLDMCIEKEKEWDKNV